MQGTRLRRLIHRSLERPPVPSCYPLLPVNDLNVVSAKSATKVTTIAVIKTGGIIVSDIISAALGRIISLIIIIHDFRGLGSKTASVSASMTHQVFDPLEEEGSARDSCRGGHGILEKPSALGCGCRSGLCRNRRGGNRANRC